MTWPVEVRSAVRHLACELRDDLHGPAAVALAALQRANAHAADTLTIRLERSRGVDNRAESGAAGNLRQLLIMPVGDRCNLACRYCYEATRRETPAGTMSRVTLRRIMENVLPFVRDPFAIGWHGGEPLMRGKDFYRAAFAMVQELSGGGRIQQIVQSNATLLDDDWVSLFREHGVVVGISLDGPPALHDDVRVRLDGRGSYDAVLRGITALRAGGLDFSTIVVISAAHTAKRGEARRLFEHFRDIGVSLYDVHPAYGHSRGAGQHNLAPDAFAHFIIELFDCWLDAGDTSVRINFFEHILQGMSGQRSVACYLSGGCTTILGVGPDGTVIPCTRPFDRSYTFGNLANQPLPDILAGRAFNRFAEEEREGRTRTAECEWANLCGAGCPHERMSDGQQAVDGQNVYCTCRDGGAGGYPEIFRHIRARMATVIVEAASVAVRHRQPAPMGAVV